MTTRRESRERALSLLYEAERKETMPKEILDALDVTPDEYVVKLVTGVNDNFDAIDTRIKAASTNWELGRMPAVDRAILRLGCFEMLYGDETDVAIVLDEAIELAKGYSTDGSPAFVNGVLAAIARESHDDTDTG